MGNGFLAAKKLYSIKKKDYSFTNFEINDKVFIYSNVLVLNIIIFYTFFTLTFNPTLIFFVKCEGIVICINDGQL